MKKKISFLIIFIVLVFSQPLFVNSNGDQTLQDLMDELEAKKYQLEQITNDKSLTEKRIKEIQGNINKINNDIIIIEKNIDQLNKDIINLNEEIVIKNDEVKKIINYYQLSNGENSYLEFIFGAKSMTDFIYRLSIVEQLTKHNDNLINTMNDMIVKSENKTKELAQEKVTISNKKQELYEEQFKLGDRADELNEHSISLKDEINDAIKTIENYRKIYNCKPTDKIKDCTSVANSTSFVRPLDRGIVTNEYGWPVAGIYSNHSGIDVAGNSTGTTLYPAASGNVVYVSQLNVSYLRSILKDGDCTYWPGRTNYHPSCSCGGNYVIIQHRVNGQDYATRYLHMNQVSVKAGDRVTPTTVIGTVGGGEFYDRCSTGPHLHLDVGRGIYATPDFHSFLYSSKAVINPRTVINFPAYGVWFNSRY